MIDETKQSLWDHATDFIRQLLVWVTAASVIGAGSIAVFNSLFGDEISDLLSAPKAIERIEQKLGLLQEDLQLVTFQGNGVITTSDGKRFVAGQIIDAAYLLKRHATCETNIKPIFQNVDTNRPFIGETVESQKAPVTDSYIFFPIPIFLPEDIPPGRYTYMADIQPLECGVYEEYRSPMTDIFTIVESE